MNYGDVFIAKYDADGALIWAKKAGGSSREEGFSIACDGSGNSIITGYFGETVTFAAGETNETMLTSKAFLN